MARRMILQTSCPKAPRPGDKLALMIEPIGRFFFRTRNAVFPILLATLLIAFPPRGFGDWRFDALALLGVALLVLGQGLRVMTVGLDYIKRGGKKKRIYADRLVTGGIYAHCRNPMYTGNIGIALGLLCIAGNPWAIALGGAFVLFVYYAITRGEEAYLRDRFGDQYLAFVARTRRWIPRLRGMRATLRAYRFDWPGVVVKEYSTIYSSLILATIIVAAKGWRGGTLPLYWPWIIAAAALWTALFLTARYFKKARSWRARGVAMLDATLEERRRRIDIIDSAILDLLNQRAIEVDSIFEFKRAASMGRVDPGRMAQMIDRLVRQNPGPLTEADVRSLGGAIIEHFAHRYVAASLEEPAEADRASGSPGVVVVSPAIAGRGLIPT